MRLRSRVSASASRKGPRRSPARESEGIPAGRGQGRIYGNPRDSLRADIPHARVALSRFFREIDHVFADCVTRVLGIWLISIL